jgi:hypothetical protein
MEYTNRYNDVYTFTLQENGDVLWEGSFEWCRYGWPNVYKEAYQQYRKDGGDMHIEDFKKEVHHYDDVTFEYSEISKKYQSLIYSDQNTINMVDPSGGPYLTRGIDLGEYLGKEFENRIVSSFVPVETGYLIQTYGKFDHLQDRDIIGGII